MLYRWAADLTLVLHLAFIVFAVFGAALAARWPWVVAAHLPAAGWATFVELTGRICPLTHLENHFLVKAGGAGYPESFIDHYLLPLIYPAGLTRDIQHVLGLSVVLINAALYAWLLLRWRARRRRRT